MQSCYLIQDNWSILIDQQKYFVKRIKQEIEKRTMRLNNFEDNMTLIQQNNQAFQSFLNQIKRKMPQTREISFHLRQSVFRSSQSEQISDQRMENSFNKKPQIQTSLQKPLRKNILSLCGSKQKDFFNQPNPQKQKVVIRDLNKLNPNPNKSFQQEKVKKQQQSAQLIELKSVKQLPSWLFQHIRKSNQNELKNRLLKQNQRKNVKSYQEADRPQKVSSSFQIRRPNKKSLRINQKVKKIQDFVISEYQYSYCPQNEQDSTISKVNFIKNSSFPQSFLHSQSQEFQQKKSKSYRIRQKEKPKIANCNPFILRSRLETVSEQNPLIGFQKN